MSLHSSFLNRRWFVGPDHLLLREAICRATHDRVQPVQHMGSPVMRQDQEIQRPWHLLLPQVQGLATVRSQKRHLEAEGRESLSLLFLHSFSFDAYCQNSLWSHQNGKVCCHCRVSFDNHHSLFILHIYLLANTRNWTEGYIDGGVSPITNSFHFNWL